MNTLFKRLGMLTLVLVLAMTALVGCGPKNLQEAMDNDDVKQQISTLESSGVKVYAEDNTLVYEYTYPDTYDFSNEELKKQAKNALKSATKNLDATFESVVSNLEEATKLTGLSVKVIYKTDDGDVLYEETFSYDK